MICSEVIALNLLCSVYQFTDFEKISAKEFMMFYYVTIFTMLECKNYKHMLCIFHGIDSVSYTHLDVYKRQVCVCVCVCVQQFVHRPSISQNSKIQILLVSFNN